MRCDEALAGIAERQELCRHHKVDITKVPDFNKMYGSTTLRHLFFTGTSHQVDLGTGNKIRHGQQAGARGHHRDRVPRARRGLVVAPKDYSTKYRY